ncbi:hypothetical protein DAEQUDRAFT_739704 [Daedalea quercina L-15889]|uniref:DUF6534 domain-containing protein n=1 Tax=Daedalea quercina L-15889 TaxID=1314783 RepID=A0A165NGW3_9APHY|nr:hypothetical protein DAEQUDRAFT_739704 [Daedalea quercina L-15889]
MTSFDTSLGCFFIGIILSTLFYGCTLGQVVYYARHYKEDRWLFKGFLIWEFLVTGHADLLKLASMPPSGVAEYLVATIVVLMVQIYYSTTIWKLVHKTSYKILITSLVVRFPFVDRVARFLMHAMLTENVYEVAKDPSIPGVYIKTEVPATVQPLLACIADISITAALSVLLQRERTMFHRTDNLINILTMWAINRGALTAALQTAQAVSYIAASKSVFYWSIFHFAGGKALIVVLSLAYVNSVLAMNFIRSGGLSRRGDDFSAHEMPMANLSTGFGSKHLSYGTRNWQWGSRNAIMYSTDVVEHVDPL